MKTEYAYGTIVKYSTGNISGEAKVVGIAGDYCVVGKQYILEDISGNLPNEVYKYNTFICFECMMSKK